MAINPKRLAGGTLTTSIAIYYTASAAVKARIDQFSVANYSGTAATFSLWLVPSGGSPDDTNIVIIDRSIAAKASGRLLEAIGQWLEGGGTIQMSSSAPNAITITASGIEQTAL